MNNVDRDIANRPPTTLTVKEHFGFEAKLLAIDEPGEGASAPEPQFVARVTMAALPPGLPEESGPDDFPPVDRVDAMAVVLGPEPSEEASEEEVPQGHVTSSDLVDRPPDIGDPLD